MIWCATEPVHLREDNSDQSMSKSLKCYLCTDLLWAMKSWTLDIPSRTDFGCSKILIKKKWSSRFNRDRLQASVNGWVRSKESTWDTWFAKGVILRDTPTFLRHMAEWLEVLALESASRSKPGYGHLSAMNPWRQGSVSSSVRWRYKRTNPTIKSWWRLMNYAVPITE